MAEQELEAIFELGEEQEFDCLFTIDATTFDYSALDNKPKINGETLEGDKSSSDLHLASEQGLIDEIENRQDADININNRVDGIVESFDGDIERLEQNIESEATTRAENDTLLQNNINALDEKVDGINANLTKQIDDLEQDVNDKYNELVNDIDNLSTTVEESVVALQQEDTALQNQINAHSTTLTAYDTRITNNTNAITQEITNRQNADDNLQEQIDGITAGSDVKDIVGTYVELQAYDKSTLGDNDIIKVLNDETKENASTYYRYNASTQSFTYIGKEGPFYTKSETDTLLNAKQNTITDLTTIRDNAQAGKVASDTIANYGDIVTHNADEFATTTALTNGLATKQDKLTAGANITIQNNVISASGGLSEVNWGNITGEIANQTDLQTALDTKQDVIPDLDTYVKNTDYATGSTGGVVKTSGTYAITTSNNGYLQAQVKTKDQYDSLSSSGFISKGTLENIKEDLVTSIGDNKYSTLEQYNYLDEKVRDIELFKFPNAVIVGAPTISNGQVSGFSSENYMQFPFILDLHNTPFQIDFAFTTGQDVTTQQNILDSEFGLALAIANGKGLMAISSNGTSWDIGSSVGSIAILPNTTYYARLTWNGMQYKTFISTNGTDYVQDMYLVGVQRPYPRTIYIGGCSGSAIAHTPHPFLGSINMNKSYLSTNGQVIWQGMDDAGLATRADISLSNLDELGEKRFNDKQDKLTAGANISIENNEISVTGDLGAEIIMRTW